MHPISHSLLGSQMVKSEKPIFLTYLSFGLIAWKPIIESYCYRPGRTLSNSLFHRANNISSCKFSFLMIILCSEKGVWKFWKLQMKGYWERTKKPRKRASVPKRNVAQIVFALSTKTKMWSHDWHRNRLAPPQWRKSGVWRHDEFPHWCGMLCWEMMVFMVARTVLERKRKLN